MAYILSILLPPRVLLKAGEEVVDGESVGRVHARDAEFAHLGAVSSLVVVEDHVLVGHARECLLYAVEVPALVRREDLPQSFVRNDVRGGDCRCWVDVKQLQARVCPRLILGPACDGNFDVREFRVAMQGVEDDTRAFVQVDLLATSISHDTLRVFRERRAVEHV